MKKIITLAVLGMLGAVPVSAQTVYDAANIANKDLNGTARFVSMGGAMGALGGRYFHYCYKPCRYRYLSQ